MKHIHFFLMKPLAFEVFCLRALADQDSTEFQPWIVEIEVSTI